MLNHISERKHGAPQFFTLEEIRIFIGKADINGDVSLDKKEFYDFYKKF